MESLVVPFQDHFPIIVYCVLYVVYYTVGTVCGTYVHYADCTVCTCTVYTVHSRFIDIAN